MALSEGQIKQYAEGGGVKCPHCGSPEIEGMSGFECDAGYIDQEVRCGGCGKAWHDVYRLVGISER